MKIIETREVEVHVAPCIECGSTDITIADCGYSSFNKGGGKCKSCGHEVYQTVSCLPNIRSLIGIWNTANDIDHLIAQEHEKIQNAQRRIDELTRKKVLR